jgi:NTE family protein
VPTIRRLTQVLGRPIAGVLPRVSSDDGPPLRPVDRLARVITGRTVGVAFGAGAAKGLAHLGVLRAFDELRMPIDAVSGCSIGSAVASSVASRMPVDEFEQIVMRVAKRAVRPTLPIHSFLSNAGIKDELRQIAGDQRIEDLDLPLAIVAVDLFRRTPVAFTSGLIWPRIAASMAIPGVYPASAGMGSYLVDGGVLSPVPVRQCRDLGAGIVIGVRLTATKTSPRDELEFRPKKPFAVEAFIRSFDIMLNRISEMSHEPADLNVDVCIEGTGGIRDFERVAEISQQGYAATMSAASAWQTSLPYIEVVAT